MGLYCIVLYIGCVRLAPLGLPRCVAGFFFLSRTNVGNYLHTFVLGKKNSTHRGRPREAKRTHPFLCHVLFQTGTYPHNPGEGNNIITIM